MRKSTKPVGATQKKILNTSWKLFIKHGYEKTTYQMIADELGISKAIITYYFKSKPWILYWHFTNYANAIREYITTKLTTNFNYYLYFCILTIHFFSNIMKSEYILKLFNHPELIDLHTTEWLQYFKEDLRNITEDFHKDFSDEDIYIATLMGTGARIIIMKEFSSSTYTFKEPCCSISQCCKYLAYMPGAFSRLDEATIMRNIDKAFRFLEEHDLSSIILGECDI